MTSQLPVYTLGHSTLGIEEFLGLLRHYGIERLVGGLRGGLNGSHRQHAGWIRVENDKNTRKPDPARQWLTTFSWQDKLIARCFPRFFKRYAPQEIQEQWAAYLEKKQKREK